MTTLPRTSHSKVQSPERRRRRRRRRERERERERECFIRNNSP
jgi:hypothetical protein